MVVWRWEKHVFGHVTEAKRDCPQTANEGHVCSTRAEVPTVLVSTTL